MQLVSKITRNNINQIFKYGIVGICGVLIDALIYALLFWQGVPIIVAKGISFFAAVIFGYFFNMKWTFESRFSTKVLINYCILYAISIVANLLVNSYVIQVLEGFKYNIVLGFVFATAISIMITFLGLKLWVFKKT